MSKVFLTGASGFVGGDFLAAVTKAHPEYAIRTLVRSQKAAERVQKAFSTVQPVLGDLDEAETLRKEAFEADIVINLAAAKHLEGLKAMHEGAAKREKAYFIQISGATLISQSEIFSKTFGKSSNSTYDDLNGAQDLRDTIKKYPNREVENYLLDISKQKPHVRNAMVIAPLIYGQGRGPVNQTSIQIPELCRIAIERGRAAQIGDGQNIWSNIHVADLSSLLVQLVEKAVAEDRDENWGENGLYFAESDAGITFESLVQRIADSGHGQGLLPGSEVDRLSADEMDELIPHGSGILGTNARVQASRARQDLSWHPTQLSFDTEIPRALACTNPRM